MFSSKIRSKPRNKKSGLQNIEEAREFPAWWQRGALGWELYTTCESLSVHREARQKAMGKYGCTKKAM
jgi:hypothetical protein